MGHTRLRPDNTCLNCGTTVQERYCSHCGQENIEPKESLSHLIRHFFEDITHYDSKFFRFYKYLMTRPGYLSREYFAGHRASYLNPIRAYIFISFVFFLVLFSGKKDQPENETTDTSAVQQQIAQQLRNTAKNTIPLTAYDSLKKKVVEGIAEDLDPASASPKGQSIFFGVSTKGIKFVLQDTRYKNLREYDSVQNALPDTAQGKDKGFARWISRAHLRLKGEYGNRGTVVLAENFQQKVPKVMFVLLPLFALYVMLFYSRKKYLYAQHCIFSIHYHSFVFLLFLLNMLLSWLIPVPWFELILQLLCVLALFFYLVMALKNTYHQSFWKSFGKAVGISLLYIISLVVVILLLAAFTLLAA